MTFASLCRLLSAELPIMNSWIRRSPGDIVRLTFIMNCQSNHAGTDTYWWHHKGSYLHMLTLRWSRQKSFAPVYDLQAYRCVCVCVSVFKLHVTWMPTHFRKSCLNFISYTLN